MIFKNSKKRLVGAHISISGGIENAPERGKNLNLDAIQIFTKNQRQWVSKRLKKEVIESFKNSTEKYGIITVAHASYLINLAANEESLWLKSKASFLEEINRCAQLNIPYLVFHPGSHNGFGEEYGIERIAEAINETLNRSDRTVLLLETTAGQGTNIGYTFDHLKSIIKKVKNKDRVGVCIDTCHIYAAGYDIANNYENVIEEFEATIGLNKLKVIHLNDSEKGLGSKIDRHAHIGKGKIGAKGFVKILDDERLESIPFILETPQGENEYYLDLQEIKKIIEVS
ncbi:MAG: deoxyribonuclease IV [Thermoplasmata archaeon]